MIGPKKAGRSMQTDVRDYRAVLDRADFKNVETGQTRHQLLAFVRGRVGK